MTEIKLARKYLVHSATEAFKDGIFPTEWMKEPGIIAYAKKYSIAKDLEHIAHWAAGVVGIRYR